MTYAVFLQTGQAFFLDNHCFTQWTWKLCSQFNFPTSSSLSYSSCDHQTMRNNNMNNLTKVFEKPLTQSWVYLTDAAFTVSKSMWCGEFHFLKTAIYLACFKSSINITNPITKLKKLLCRSKQTLSIKLRRWNCKLFSHEILRNIPRMTCYQHQASVHGSDHTNLLIFPLQNHSGASSSAVNSRIFLTWLH